MTYVKQLRYGDDDTSPNRLMRKLGNKNYMADLDCAQYEYLPDGSTKTVCIIDWKHFNTSTISYNSGVCKDASSLRYFRDLANREKVPFFIGLCYTKPEDGYADRPMFCLVPGNKRANAIIKNKVWYSEREMAVLMASLRSDYNPLLQLNLTHLQDYEPIKYPLTCWIDESSLMDNWKHES